MMRQIKQLVGLYCAVLLVNGCAENGSSGVIENDVFTTQPPLQMRALPADELRAVIRVDNTSLTVSGSDFPDGNWRIPLDLEANQTYSLEIDWSYSNYQLMEERGTFSTSENSFRIRPDLEFVNAGYQRFDNDCDGDSNLEELIAGNDPDTLSSTGTCAGEADPDIEFNGGERPYLGKRYQPFGQINDGRAIDKFEQPVQVRRGDNNRRYSLGGVLSTNDDSDDLGILTNILLVNDPELGRSASFIMDQVTGFTQGNVPGARCEARPTLGPQVWRCTAPYVWEENSWYTLVIEQTGDRAWQGSVVDQSTGDEVIMGTLTSDVDIVWTLSQVGIGYSGFYTRTSCLAGFPLLAMHFTNATVNNVINAVPRNSIIEPCVGITGDWNHSRRQTATGTLHALSVGVVDE